MRWKPLLLPAVVLAEKDWPDMTSLEREEKLASLALQDETKKKEAILSYIAGYETEIYPGYQETFHFLALLSSFNDSVPDISDGRFKTERARRQISRLLDIPPKYDSFIKFEGHMTSKVVSSFISSIEPDNIPITFFNLIDYMCNKSKIKEYCNIREQYVYYHSLRRLRYKDVMKMLHYILNNDFILDKKTQIFLVTFPLAFHMFFGKRTLLQSMLFDHTRAKSMLAVLPYFPLHLRRVDNEIFCDYPLSDFIPEADASFFRRMLVDWGTAPIGCFSSGNFTSKSEEAYRAYGLYTEYMRTLYTAYRMEIMKQPNVKTMDHGYYLKYVSTLLHLFVAVDDIVLPFMCSLLQHEKSFSEVVWDPRTDRIYILSTYLWRIWMRNDCKPSVYNVAVQNFAKDLEQNKVAFPEEAFYHCFSPTINESQQETIMNLKKKNYAKRTVEEDETLEEIKDENFLRFEKGKKCHAFVHIPTQFFFKKPMMTENMTNNLIRFFDRFVIMSLQQHGVESVFKLRLFHEFLNTAHPTLIQKLILNTNLVQASIEQSTKSYSANQLFSLIERLQNVRNTVKAQYAREKSGRSWIYRFCDSAMDFLIGPDRKQGNAYYDLEPYAVTLFKRLMQIQTFSEPYFIRFGFFPATLSGAKNKILSCLKSIITIIFVDSQVKSFMDSVQTLDFFDDQYLEVLLKHGVCQQATTNRIRNKKVPIK